MEHFVLRKKIMRTKSLPNRFMVTEVFNNENESVLTLKTVFSINDQVELFKCILRNFWRTLVIEVDDFVNIFDARVENENSESPKTLIIDHHQGLLILKPDVLISTTTVMGASFCMRKAWLSRLFEIHGEANLFFFVGNVVHELFQESMKQNKFSIEDIKKIFFDQIVPKITMDLYSLSITCEDLLKEIDAYFHSISSWLTLYADKSGNQKDALFSVHRLHDIENTIWSTKYGFIGKIDLSLEIVLNDSINLVKSLNLIPLELKTGNHSFSPQHIGQVILYSFIMAEKYPSFKTSDGFLVYLKDKSSTQHVKTNHNVFRDLILLRNNFVRFYDKLGLTKDSNFHQNEKFLINAPEPINVNRICQKCDHNLDCSLVYSCFETKNAVNKLDIASVAISHLKNDEIEYFSKVISLLEIEKQHSITNDEFVHFWNISSENCENSGIGLSKMQIKHQDKQCIVFRRSTKIAEKLPKELLTTNSELNINYSLLEGRRVIISEEMLNSTKTFQVYGSFCKQLCVTTGQINSFRMDNCEVEIILEKDQINFINPNATFRIDFLKNLSTRAMLINFSNLLRLMSPDDPRAAELRELVVRGTVSKFNLNDLKLTSFTQITNSSVFSKLNIQQKKSILGVLKTKFSLVFGSPGSGKTQTIVALIRVLFELGCSVLVTSYTHNAVDNILLKLVAENNNSDNKVDFLRIGSLNRVHIHLKNYVDSVRTKNWIQSGDLNALQKFYSNIPLVATTCLGVFNHAIFNKRTFDFCIVDEASQIFSSTCIGPLFNCKNFVLVGDPKQLPPVIQNSFARSHGLEESLFVRLLNKSSFHTILSNDGSSQESDLCENDFDFQKNTDKNKIDLQSVRIFPLFLQYRMNSVIMKVANKLVYKNKLKCASKDIETSSLTTYLKNSEDFFLLDHFKLSYMEMVVSPNLENSVVFIDTTGVEQAIENCDNESVQLKNVKHLLSKKLKFTKSSFVYNQFEAQLVFHIVQKLLFIYGRNGLKTENIGLISPFRFQVNKIKEVFGKDFLNEKNLEINTVDQYQGRDKEVIIFSCVKSKPTFNSQSVFGSSTNIDSSQQFSVSQKLLQPILDSDLLQDERRLNVAVTRAKKKLILIGNRNTLTRYKPFESLFRVLDGHQFIQLANYDYADINQLL